VTLTDLGIIYAVAGVISGALAHRAGGQRAERTLGTVVLAVVLWPLWLPVVLASATPPRPAQNAAAGATERALIEAHAAVRDGPLAALLPSAAMNRLLAEVRRANERHTELEQLLAAKQFGLPEAEARVLALERQGASPRVLSSARLHLDNVRRLWSLCEHDQRALDELSELAAALRTQLLLAHFAGSSPNDASDIVSELWARVEVLGATLDPSDPSAIEVFDEPHADAEARFSGG
jgi:hypothetical protein